MEGRAIGSAIACMRSQKLLLRSRYYIQLTVLIISYTNSINDCNTSLGEDAMNRVSTNGLFVTYFFQIGIRLLFPYYRREKSSTPVETSRSASPTTGAPDSPKAFE